MQIDLELLGMTQEDLQQRIVDRAAEMILDGKYDGDDEGSFTDGVRSKLQDLIKERIDATVKRIADEHVLPHVDNLFQTVSLQETNEWGEKKNVKALTFIEYITMRAGEYLKEEVNRDGKSRQEHGSGYFEKYTTRVTFLIHRYLQHTVESTMREALKSANAAIVGGIQKAVEIELANLVGKIKPDVTIAR